MKGPRFWAMWAFALAALVVIHKLLGSQSAFPDVLVHPVREPVDAFAYWLPETFRFFLKPLSEGIRYCLEQTDLFFL